VLERRKPSQPAPIIAAPLGGKRARRTGRARDACWGEPNDPCGCCSVPRCERQRSRPASTPSPESPAASRQIPLISQVRTPWPSGAKRKSAKAAALEAVTLASSGRPGALRRRAPLRTRYVEFNITRLKSPSGVNDVPVLGIAVVDMYARSRAEGGGRAKKPYPSREARLR
jgi:hypothetical protein